MLSAQSVLSVSAVTGEISAPQPIPSDGLFARSFDVEGSVPDVPVAASDPAATGLASPFLWFGFGTSVPNGGGITVDPAPAANTDLPIAGVTADTGAWVEAGSLGPGSTSMPPDAGHLALSALEVAAPGADRALLAVGVTSTSRESGADGGPQAPDIGGPAAQEAVQVGGEKETGLRGQDVGPSQSPPDDNRSRPMVAQVTQATPEFASPGREEASSLEGDRSREDAAKASDRDSRPEERLAAGSIAIAASGPFASHPGGRETVIPSLTPPEPALSALRDPGGTPALAMDAASALAPLDRVALPDNALPRDAETPAEMVDGAETPTGKAPAGIVLAEGRPATQTHAPPTFWERFFFDLAGAKASPAAGVPTEVAPNVQISRERFGAVAPPLVQPALPKPMADMSFGATNTESAGHEAVALRKTGALPDKVTLPMQASPPGLTETPSFVVHAAGWTEDTADRDKMSDFGLSAPSGIGSMPTSGPAGRTDVLSTFPVSQVAAQLAATFVPGGDSATELALAPEELGRVKLRFESDPANPDRVVILISVERPETLDLFRRHAGELAEAIRAAGYSGADIGFGPQSQGHGGERQEAFANPGALPSPDDAQPPAPPPGTVGGASLDLRL